MSAGVVARKELRGASRSRLLWALTGIFGLLATIGVAAPALFDLDADATDALGVLVVPAELLLPITAVVVGYMAVVGERRSGSLRVLLGLPLSRRDVLLGKVLGRAAATILAAFAGFGIAAVVAVVLYEGVPLVGFGLFALVTTGFCLPFVAIAVGISAASRSRGRAMAGAMGTVVLFCVLWNPLLAALHYVVVGDAPGATVPGWYLLAERLNPLAAYEHLAGAVLDGSVGGLDLFVVRPPAATTRPLAEQVIGTVPWYLADSLPLVVLAAWSVVPVVLGYQRFRAADL